MYFKQFLHDQTGCASYLIASRATGEAVVVDPQYDVEQYLDLADERGYRVVHVIDTHIHADHVSGGRRLAEATGAPLHMYEGTDVLFPIAGLRENEEIRLGQIVLRVLHTPGHRPESISLAVTNAERSPEPAMLLTGDCLFVGDVGRPDFGGTDATREEYQSIQKILKFEDYVEVFPAHFEGSCGKSMCGRPSSTIGFERRFNPVARLSEPEFSEQLSEHPARPLNMNAIIATNRGVADYSWVRPRAEPQDAPVITIDEAPGWLSAHPNGVVVDVREPVEFLAGHIPNALSIPQSELALRLSDLPKDRELLVVCESGMRSQKASRFLQEAGYAGAVNLVGGTGGWRRAGLPIEREAAA